MFDRARPSVRALWSRYRVHGLPDVAAAVSFWAFLSLFPFLLAIAALLGELRLVVGDERAARLRERVRELVEQYLSGRYAEDIGQQMLDVLAYRNPGLAIAATAAALASASKGFAGMCRALAVVHGDPSRRSGWRARVVGLGLGTGTAVLFCGLAAELTFGSALGAPVLAVTVAVAVVAWLTVLLRVGPGLRARWRDVLPGALTASALWVLTTAGFAAALRFGVLRVNPLFGVLGTVIVFLSWLQALATGLLLGAEVNAHRLGHPVQPRAGGKMGR